MRVIKRHVLLLEVLIALMLVVLCILPLLTPHVAMVQEERKFQREIELDRLVSQIYAELLVEGFYRQNVQWWSIMNKSIVDIQDHRVADLGYTGSYFIERKNKKNMVGTDDYRFNLLLITYAFTPLEGGDTLKYTYKLFVQRPGELLNEEDNPSEEDEEVEEESA